MNPLAFRDCGDNRGEIVFPWIHGRILALKAKTLLDFGCGDARFSSLLAAELTGEIWAYDNDSGMQELAKELLQRESDSKVILAKTPEQLPENRVDLAFMLGVWMCWSSDEECKANLAILNRKLRAGGTLIASVTHPCFRDRKFATYHTDFEMNQYLKNGTPFKVFVGREGKRTVINDTHWSLEAMLQQATESGFILTGLKEHADEPATFQPPWLSLELQKLG